MTRSHLFLFSAITVIGAMAVFVLVAAVFGESIAEAQKKTMEFLVSWGGVAPERLHKAIAITIGGSTGFALLFALALALDSLADASIHKVSRLFGHFGIPEVVWSERRGSDWKAFRNSVRVRWGEAFPDEDISRDKEKWEAFKNDRGKHAVRASRTLTYFSAFVVVAGVVDLLSWERWGRGAALLVIGLVAMTALCYVWADRKASYVNEISSPTRDWVRRRSRSPTPGAVDEPMRTPGRFASRRAGAGPGEGRRTTCWSGSGPAAPDSFRGCPPRD